ncbi:MAG: hypothetical protein K9G41_07920 [Flavobacteriales bacterium]|nr:hypothetical protein [Flavobacteriales bacterium]
MKRQTLFTLTLCLFLMVLANLAMAQPLPPAPNPTEGAPIDGLTTILMLSGIAYGAKKLRSNKTDI